LSEGLTPDQPAGRNHAHEALVIDLYRAVRAAGHQAATACVTLHGKRPDLCSISRSGDLVIWEAKTRYTQHERMQAWLKYHRHCHRLFMVYPFETDLFNWSPATWGLAPVSSRFCGAILVSPTAFRIEREARSLTPEPNEMMHLTNSVLRLHGSTARKFNALA
jgi:hypothetical protein